jgi:preprotein translocase subunit SecG
MDVTLTLITVFHFILATLLIIFVLLQDSKGAAWGIGATGSSQVLSSTGAANFLVKTTRVIAILFAISCVIMVRKSASNSKSAVDAYVPPPAAESQLNPGTETGTETDPAAPAATDAKSPATQN